MNLDQIATKCFILALFIRDDGQRLLLGDGYYDFNQKLQHFQGNTIANDIVEIQGDNGQLLAGQVMRSGTQKFEGYIGDATASRQIIEQKRSDFMAFFRIKHFYKVVYIFPDGTAIQRQRGYLTDAPTIPEIFQKFPEYSIALNFEDANYYEYAEDEHGDEIYAHIIELALSGAATGGLIWDAIGAVSNGISWSGIQTAQGEYISITNELSLEAPLASVEMLGKATQTTYSGKNLWTGASSPSVTGMSSTTITLPSGTYTISASSATTTGSGTVSLVRFLYDGGGDKYSSFYLTNVKLTVELTDSVKRIDLYSQGSYAASQGVTTTLTDFMIEAGSTATAYEPYVGGKASPNPDYPQPISVVTGENTVNITGKNLAKIDDNTVTSNGLTYTLLSDGTISISGTSTATSSANATADYPINLVAGQIYTLSLNNPTVNASVTLRFARSVGGVLPGTTAAAVDRTFTFTATNTGSATLQVRIASGVTLNNFILKPQLELGSTATAYEPYQGQEFPIGLGSIELATIGNYQDRIYKQDGKWYIEKQVGKVVLDGTENWALASMFYCTSPLQNIAECITPSGGNVMSDYFTWSSGAQNNHTIDIVGAYIIRIRDTDFADVSALTTWLASNPTIVYYALATPTTTEITNEALIAQLDALGASSLYVGVNNIGTETLNAVPTLKIEYYTEVDLDGAGYEWEPGGNTAKTIVTVAGVDSAWPIWTIQGGAQNPTLTNITTGQTISWQGFVPEGQTLTINMAEMTAALAGANVFEYITGEWIRLAPGNNTLVYTAGSADKPSTLSWNGVLA